MKRPFQKLLLVISVLFFVFFCSSCGTWSDNASTDSESAYFPLDDSEYPYAGLPRLVIETDDFKQINNKETKVPAHLQFYGKSGPSSQILSLTIKGRGNSSFVMTKYGYKIKLDEKVSMLGMPKDREWDLISNFRDKSMLQNYITYQLAGILGDEYFPKCKFIELYLNRQYQGIYLLVEHVKVSQNRVNIPKNDSSFLFEKTSETSTDGIMFTSSLGYIFKFCQPKEPNAHAKELLEGRINDFESLLQSRNIYNIDSIAQWIDIDDFIRYYWIQEFSKNVDGHRRSIFITWEKKENSNAPLKMGPVWDFDLGYGNSRDKHAIPNQWLIRKYGWDRFLFKNQEYEKRVKEFWTRNRSAFVATLDSIDSMSQKLAKASTNEFKKWPVLETDDGFPFFRKFNNYQEAVDSLKYWIEQRIQWIDENL
jgi:hypothetical protein